MLPSRAALLFATGALLAGPMTRGQALPTGSARDLLHQIDDAYAAVYEKVAPAVVIIDADKKPAPETEDQNFDYYFHSPEGTPPGRPHLPKAQPMRSEGSGFIVRPDGYIYTNAHVVEDSERIVVKLRDNRHFVARLVGADERTDIAVLKIDATGLPTVGMVDSDSIRVGQVCFAIGIPYDLDFSFCRGIVSAKGRGNLTADPMKPMYEDYIQTDAYINPGNSGGPLFDIDGRVMGMNTLINGIARGLSFAIPSSMLDEVGGQLIATGRVSHSWLGITVQGVEKELENDPAAAERLRGIDTGVCVDTIEANAPAYKSDLRPFDVITSVDGITVTSAHDLQREILHKKVGQTVRLAVWRAGKSLTVPVTTDELPSDLTQVAQAHPHAKTRPGDDTTYGMQFAGSTQASDFSGDKRGAVISAVVDGSPASRAGIHAGDILTTVDQHPVANPAAGLQLLAAHRGPSGPSVTVTHGSQKTRVVLDNGGGNSQP